MGDRLVAGRITSAPRGWSAGFAAVLLLVMALGIVLQPAIGALGPFLIDDLGLRRSQVGLLASFASLSSAGFAPFVGRLADRSASRHLLTVTFCLVGAGLFTVSTSPSFRWLSAAVVLTGVAMAAVNPVTNRLIALHAGDGPRGALIGLKQSGVQVGALVAGATLPALANVLGWRGAIGVLAAAAFVAASLAWRAVPRRPSVPAAEAGEASGRAANADAAVTSAGVETRWLAVYAFVMGAPTATLVSYLPLFSYDVLGYRPVIGGVVAATHALLAVAGRIVWARVADRLDRPWRVLVWLAIGAATMLALLITASVAPPLVWVAAAGAGASLGAWNSVVQLIIVRRGQGGAGRRSGVVHLAFSAGMVVGPALFGLSVDITGGYLVGLVSAVAVALLGVGMAIGGRARA